jgi:cobalt-zinc-cadmium efflux system outer membrane protein
MKVFRQGLFLLSWLVASSVQAEELALSVDDALRIAFDRSPTVQRANLEIQSARSELQGASILLRHNPELSGAAGARLTPDGTTPDYEVQLAQAIEIGGQRTARIEAATALVKTAEAAEKEARIELAADVREAFWHAIAAKRLVALAEEGSRLAGQSLDTAEQRFAAGAATRIEINAARIEVSRARRLTRVASQRSAAAYAQLRRLLVLGLAPELVLQGALPEPVPDLTLDAEPLVTRAATQRPELVARARGLEAADALQRLAEREATPTPVLGAGYQREENAHVVMGTLAIDLPVFERNQGARGASLARVGQARLEVDDAGRRIEHEVRLAAARLTNANAAAADYAGGVLNGITENLELITEAYAAGKVDFLQLLLVRRETLEAQREYVEALEELASARARLAQAVGSEGEFSP